MLLLSLCFGGSAVLAKPRVVIEGTFEKRPYRLFLPTKPAKHLLVFLHGMSRDPLRRDARTLARVIQTVHAFDDRAVLFPTARRGCPGFRPPRPDRHCWSTKAVEQDLQYVDRLLRHLRTKRSLPAGTVDIAGYSNGAYFLATALQAGKLAGYRHVGLLAGGTPRQGTFSPAKGSKLRVCIEVARDDKHNAPWGRKLTARLTKLGYRSRLAAREVDGGHLYGQRRSAAFFDWFLSGCKAAGPP